MCDNRYSDPFTKESLISGDCDRDHCNIYYVHQHGHAYRRTNVQFTADPAAEDSSADGGSNTDASFCGDDRLTLIHFPKPNEKAKHDAPACPPHILPPQMPAFFQKKLKQICLHCECKADLLWSNFLRDEQHFDACFRYVNKEDAQQQKCFLKLYTLRAPFLSDLTVSFSMVHHVRAEGDDFVTASADKLKESHNQEHMFGFMYGLDGKQMKTLLTGLVTRWQDIALDHAKPSTGITPRLFVAALISQYGSIISETIKNVYMDLRSCDQSLKEMIPNLEGEKELDPSSDQTGLIREINRKLINMNIGLTGTKSTMHYLTESAEVMVNHITSFEEYVKTRLEEWHKSSERTRLKKELTFPKEPDFEFKRNRTLTFNTKLQGALQELDSCSEGIRDRDKLVMVRKNMLQYKIDIESLQQHININVGMVRNLIAARDRSIQQTIMANTARDGTKMKFMAILTAFFLPGTFMAVLLSTPMFNLVDDKKPLLTRGGIPLGIYWGITILGFVLFLAALCLLNNPGIICKLIDALVPIESIRNGPFYHDCRKRGTKLKDEAAARKIAIETTKTNQPADNAKAKRSQKSSRANGTVVTTSADAGSQGGSDSSAGWSHKGKVVLRGDNHV